MHTCIACQALPVSHGTMHETQVELQMLWLYREQLARVRRAKTNSGEGCAAI